MKPVLYGMSAMFYINLLALFEMGNLGETSGEKNVSSFGTARLD